MARFLNYASLNSTSTNVETGFHLRFIENHGPNELTELSLDLSGDGAQDFLCLLVIRVLSNDLLQHFFRLIRFPGNC